jgi:hypothetical protein
MPTPMFPTSNRHRVWIVEDSALDAALAVRVLTPEMETVVFPDGASAIEAVSTAHELPDVILAEPHDATRGCRGHGGGGGPGRESDGGHRVRLPR